MTQYEKKRILITGHKGFIGSNLYNFLNTSEYDLIGLDIVDGDDLLTCKLPDVDCVIMGRPVMSTVEYTQMIGRGMRGTRMGGTKIVWLIDFDDQVQRTTEVADQVISLGWKSMAFDTNDNPIWKRLEDYEYDDDRNLLNLNAITETKESILELKKVKDYISRLDNIQKHIFSRDGSVATSLRSWALNSISIKASEYLSVLNTKIQRIALSEKARDVSIACHSKTEVLELESLSGGEKVSVALALRLGMANLLGSSNLNLMILDEPTTHLDAERKKSLVEVLAQLSGIGKSQTAMQFLIITHDAEIFENEYVGQIYEFKSTEEGSKVKSL